MIEDLFRAQGQILTQRLRLRPLEDGDARGLTACCSDPAVMEFLGGMHPHAPEAIAAGYIRAARESVSKGNRVYAITRENDGRFLGTIGLSYAQTPSAWLSYFLRRDAWGKGYAGEAATALIAHDVAQPHPHSMRSINAAVDANNIRSRRLLERLGFGGWTPCASYHLDDDIIAGQQSLTLIGSYAPSAPKAVSNPVPRCHQSALSFQPA